MFKTRNLLAILALSVLVPGCAVDAASSEDVGEASEPLSQTDSMGAVPWSAVAGWSTDFTIAHEVDNVLGKSVTLDMYGDFSEFVGTTNVSACNNSHVHGFLFQRDNSTQSWTQIAQFTWFATAVTDGSGKITECLAAFEMRDCDAITFTQNQLLWEIDTYSNGVHSTSFKEDIVRHVTWTSC